MVDAPAAQSRPTRAPRRWKVVAHVRFKAESGSALRAAAGWDLAALGLVNTAPGVWESAVDTVTAAHETLKRMMRGMSDARRCEALRAATRSWVATVERA